MKLKCILMLSVILTHTAAMAVHKAAFVSGGLYNEQVSNMKYSGFDTVLCWSIHVNWNGSLNLNNDTLINANGDYVYGQWAQTNMAKLKQSPTSITRVEFSVGAAGTSDFSNIKNLVNNQGTGPNSALHKNFQKLKTVFPQLDAINLDTEETYDVDSTVKFCVMLADLGYKVTFCPYSRRTTFWSPVYEKVEQQRPGTIDHIYLQCYAGGGFNNPATWNGYFGNLIVEPGMWAYEEDTPAQVQAQMATWRSSAGITGGFIWRLGYMWSGGHSPSQYSSAIENALSGVLYVQTHPVDAHLPESVLGTTQPVFSLTADSGTAMTYQWYKTTDQAVDTPADDTPVGTNSNTLTLNNLSLNSEGYYFCRLTNTLGETAHSQVVRLVIQRLMGHWKMDNSLTDETAGNRAGSYTSPPAAFITGKDSSALVLQNDADHVVIANSAEAFNFYDLGLTASCWIKTSDNTWSALMGKEDRGQLPWTGFVLDIRPEGTVHFELRDVGVVTSTTSVIDNQWHLVTVTYDGATGRTVVYVDGQEQATTTFLATPRPASNPLVIGTETPDGVAPYVGVIDDVRVYSYAMDALEVLDLYNQLSDPDKVLCMVPYASELDIASATSDITQVDFVPDCIVNLYDIAVFSAYWMDCGLYPDCD